MLEQGQGLYFTPKRARKFKVETIFNLSPAEHVHGCHAPALCVGISLPWGEHTAGNKEFMASTLQWKRCFPALSEAGEERP